MLTHTWLTWFFFFCVCNCLNNLSMIHHNGIHTHILILTHWQMLISQLLMIFIIRLCKDFDGSLLPCRSPLLTSTSPSVIAHTFSSYVQFRFSPHNKQTFILFRKVKSEEMQQWTSLNLALISISEEGINKCNISTYSLLAMTLKSHEYQLPSSFK